MTEIIKPEQITLVPDAIDQITSDHGWSSGKHDSELKNLILLLKENSNDAQISLFIDNIEGVDYAAEMGANCLLYTSPSPRDQRGSRMPSSA